MGLLAGHRTGQETGALYRVTRTVVTGQWADYHCIKDWLKQPGLALVDEVPEPGLGGGVNNRVYLLWRQTAPVPLPKACELTLVTSAGKNGWESEDAARGVIDNSVAASANVDATVVKANDASVDPSNWVKDALDGDDKPSEWGWVKWVLGGAVVVGGIYSVAKLLRG